MSKSVPQVMLAHVRTTLLEALVLLVVGSTAGIALHALRDDGVRLGVAPPPSGPVVCEAPVSARPSGPRWIGAEDARRLLDDAATVFVDSRPRNEYVEGHVVGAINLPRDEPWSTDDMRAVRGARTVVTYCDGHDACACSSSLADALAASGIEDVRVLEGGAETWLARGFPGEAGLCRLCPQ